MAYMAWHMAYSMANGLWHGAWRIAWPMAYMAWPMAYRSVQSTFRLGEIQNSATHCLDPEIVDFWIENPRVCVDEF